MLARAYGFSNWSVFKDHVEGVNFAVFLAAVESGDVAGVRRFGEAHSEWTNHQADFRGSALHRTVLSRNEELTRVLMQLGADAREDMGMPRFLFSKVAGRPTAAWPPLGVQQGRDADKNDTARRFSACAISQNVCC